MPATVKLIVSFTANVEHINLNQTDNRADGDLQSNWDGGNNPNPFFADNPEFARALSIAINRDELVIVGYGATGIPTCNIWTCGRRHVDQQRLVPDPGHRRSECTSSMASATSTPTMMVYANFPTARRSSSTTSTSTNAVRQSNQDLIKGYWEDIGVIANMKNEDASSVLRWHLRQRRLYLEVLLRHRDVHQRFDAP